MTENLEDEAWDEMERKQAKKWNASDMAHRTNELAVDKNIINKAKWYQEGYEAGQRDEREACAKLCEESYDKQIVHYPKGYYADPNKMGQYSQSVANRCAARIRGRTE
jgi:hypothetical protein